VTVHFNAVVAPPAPGTWTLHWSTTMVAACAVVGRASPATENTLVKNIRAITIDRQAGRDAGLGAGMPCAGLVAGMLCARLPCAGIVWDLM
jgi:hypothetical protein